MAHLWVRAEQRPHEQRVGLTPDGARELMAAGIAVTVEDSPARVIPTAAYGAAGCTIAPQASWPDAPADALIFGLKELPDDGIPLIHTHIMFGHAFKGQPDGLRLLHRFRAGGGRLLDLEYLVDDHGRRVAAFGYWAGYAGAAVALKCWSAQLAGGTCGAVDTYPGSAALLDDVRAGLDAAADARPTVIVIGALGRVGTGARDLCRALEVTTTNWDMDETAGGGPFPDILHHDVFLNAILATPGCPVFVPAEATTAARRLTVIGDIACDPTSAFSPIKVYDRATDWDTPALRVADAPVLDVMAIDNLPSLLPLESSQDFAAQLLPWLRQLDDHQAGVWTRADHTFRQHLAKLPEAGQ